ncbi:MFS transporter [Zavarzinia aquatilis]|uniref:MFS transporter n=1 Tax=Zavarzinia aquatilis TaxID=2211142 RepID=A0A317EHH5_9PROT|nr:MFS transporter [Zavarzinia aquatilis]PWR25726.1 MFS transporter [Zavarzinia aquatilis]
MTPHPARPPRARGWFITGLGIGQVCSWGTLYYSFPQIAAAMEAELGWSKTALYGAATLGLLLAGLAAWPVGAAIDRGHGRQVMSLASLAAGALFFLWSRVDSLALYYLAVAGLGLLQAMTLYEPAFAVVARRTGPLEARGGITALTLWGGFASTVFIPLDQLLLDRMGWRDTLLVLGLVNIAVCAVLYAIVIDRRRDAPRAVPEPPPPGDAPARGAAAEAMAKPAFWGLAIAFTAYAATFSAFTFHLYPLLAEQGFDAGSVVAAMAVIGPAQVAGRIAIWVLAPRASVRRIGSGVVVVFPLALGALALLPPVFATAALVAALYGAANGIMTIVRGLAVPEMITRRSYGAINGLLAAPALVSKALAPAAAALLWAATGSYGAVLWAMIVGACLLALAFWLAVALSRREEGPAA